MQEKTDIPVIFVPAPGGGVPRAKVAEELVKGILRQEIAKEREK